MTQTEVYTGPAPGSVNMWILGARPDLLLIVLSPLLIAPAFWLAEQRFTVTEIAVFVAAFGAVGHHLPGMLRAYGDRFLFERFRTRFIVAPVLLIVGCVVGVYYNLLALTLLALLWGFWHAVMQVYGFARIYDAKVGSTSRDTMRLDLMLLGCWFSLGLTSSGGHMAGALSKLHLTGGPLVSDALFRTGRIGLMALTGVVTVAYAFHTIRQTRRGDAPSPVKLALMANSIGVYWYAMVYTKSTLIGIALFEVFHDIQYLAIVWGFSNRLAEKNPQIGGFTRSLFRRTRPMIALYILLVGAYGSVGFFIPKLIQSGTFHRSVNGVVIASALLHFYFDGFIWKVRERSIQAGLDLNIERSASKADAGGRPRSTPSGLIHAQKWALLLIPVFCFGLLQRLDPPGLDKHVDAADAYPYPEPHHKLGRRLVKIDRPDEALRHFRTALRLDPDFAPAHHEIGMLLMRRRPVEGIPHLARVVELEPELPKPRMLYADALRVMGRLPEASEQYRVAVALGADEAEEKLARLLIDLESKEAVEGSPSPQRPH